MRKTQLRLDVPVIVGEWGGCSDNTDTSWFGHANELLDFFDEMQWGQMYWDYHGDDLDAPLMDMLCRTHPVAVAGKIESYGIDRKNNIFNLNFTADEKGESIIYVHKPFEVIEGAKCKVIETYDSGASLIKIPAKKGENTVKIKLISD